MSRSVMFLNAVTAIDHAYIDQNGMVIGGSYNPTMQVEGNIDPKEHVVVDFSSVKKSIKHIIDSKYSGFDHKLWVINGYSNCTLTATPDGKQWKIITPLLTIECPRDAVKYISKYLDGDQNHLDAVSEQIDEEIMVELNLDYPDADLRVETQLEAQFIGSSRMDTGMFPFRYVHGLKDSTSWGCQNIAHGHLSYLAATTNDVLATDLELQKIATELDNSIFVWGKNILGYSLAGDMVIGYETPRGRFKMQITPAVVESHNVWILTNETTVENLAEFIEQKYHYRLVKAGVTSLFVSEGLNKGSVVRI